MEGLIFLLCLQEGAQAGCSAWLQETEPCYRVRGEVESEPSVPGTEAHALVLGMHWWHSPAKRVKAAFQLCPLVSLLDLGECKIGQPHSLSFAVCKMGKQHVPSLVFGRAQKLPGTTPFAIWWPP